ncbi:MAG TPA: PAS domain-containing protein, partial [Verrucomicrobiae bacterium]|nr:PAS domain-containing protein [Verrucomicrobiae bacterium]
MRIPLNILIVEDSADDATLLVHKLQAFGFEPNWKRVDTLKDYVAHLNKDVQLIFSDYSLPQFSAPHALKQLHESSFDIPFLIISGTIGEEQVVESLKAGATDYLLKNRLDRLPVVVERALREADERAQRRQFESALRESEEKFRQLAENINEVFWIIDPIKNDLVYISPAFVTIWGRPLDKNLQSPNMWLDAIHPDDRERVLKAASTKQAVGGYDEVYRIVRPDGAIRWIRDRGFPLRDAKG